MVWDIGTYELIDGNYWKGKLHISVDGKKLKGEWVFVKGHEENGKENTWYLPVEAIQRILNRVAPYFLEARNNSH